MKKLLLVAVTIACAAIVLSAQSQVEEKTMPGPPPARKIPAINAPDQFPGACVDCHINYVDMKMDTRFSTLMAQWSNEVDPKLLAKAQAAAPEGMTLKGKHPVVGQALKDIPKGCLVCHARGSKIAPPFAVMLHEIHLTGGDESHFMTIFQGECTHCHKLDLASGQWKIPSGPEK
jgi:cytochrome c553